jgi:hypothetical protein
MSSQMIRHEGIRPTGMRDLDTDRDGVLDIGTSSDRPVYAIDTNTRFSIWILFKATLKVAWLYPFSFTLFCLVIRFVIYPIVVTTPVALLRNNPTTLTDKQAGGELNALVNNTVVGARGLTGSTFDAVQNRQVKENESASDRTTGSDLMPKAKVVFTSN